MNFTHDTRSALLEAAALVNTVLNRVERLPDTEALDGFLDRYRPSATGEASPQELGALRALRPRLRAVWEAPDEGAAAEIVNRLFHDAKALPRLVRHESSNWHLHATDDEAPLSRRITAELAMGFADLIRTGELDRLRFCASDDCDAVLVDLSRNQSRRYCDTGNCGNRANVAAYRARKAAAPSR